MSEVDTIVVHHEKPKPVWSRDIENILDGIRQNAVVMNEEHKKRYMVLEGKLRYFRVPIIVIAGVNSVISVGFQPYIDQQTISAITCLLSLTCGIIGSIELYLAIQQQMESELIVCKEYYSLSTRIFAMLSLDVENRKMDGMDFFEEIFASYTNLIQKSIILADKIQDKLIPVDDITAVKKARKMINLRPLKNNKANHSELQTPYGIPPNDLENVELHETPFDRLEKGEQYDTI